MWRMGCFVLFFLGVIALGALCAPVIGVDSPTYTATVQSGSQVVHVFRLTNSGNSPLSITGVQATCGCTTTSLEKSELAPGESEDLEARVNTTGFSGTIQKTVNVQSNDPVTPTLALHLILTIVDEVKPQPAPVTPLPAQSAAVTPVRSAAAGGATAAVEWWLLAGVGVGGVMVGYLLAIALRRARREKKAE